MSRDERKYDDDADGRIAKKLAAEQDPGLSSHERELEREPGRLRMEVGVLKETMSLLKKTSGVDHAALTDMERFVVVDALRD
jgi:hypothetical protein